MNPSPADYTILINQHWKRLQMVLLIFFALTATGLSAWTHSNPYLRHASASLWFCCALLFLGPVLLGVYYRQKKIVFSVADQTVYSQTPLGRKRLMAFVDVGIVKPYSTSLGGTYFGLYRRSNLYERSPVRVSPIFPNRTAGRAAYRDFETNDLPRIQAILQKNGKPVLPVDAALNEEALVFYAQEGDRYVLKSTYSRDTKKTRASAFLLIGAAVILLTPSLRLPYFNMAIGLGLGGLIAGFLLTEKKYIQRGLFVSVFWNDLFRSEYPLRQFSRFQITHLRVNMMKAGTNVNIVFRQGSSQKEVLLSHVRKTETIDALIQETTYVLTKMGE